MSYRGCRSGVAAKSIKMIAKMVDVRRSGFELACDRFETDAFATSPDVLAVILSNRLY